MPQRARAIVAATTVFLVLATAGLSDAGRSGKFGVTVAHAAARVPWLFQTSDACVACHNGLSTASGEDISIGTAWRATMMANSSRDPYWQASVRREVLDHPHLREEIEDECAICHMPMSRYQAKAEGRKGEIFAHLPIGASTEPADEIAADGVSCTTCHQIQDVRLGLPSSFVGGFSVDESQPPSRRTIYGPYEIDSGRAQIMQSASEFRPALGTHIQKSELCATCHTLYTESKDETGRVVGRLPEQVPYLEWKHSAYDGEDQSCQSCHMPVVADSVAISGVWGQRRPRLARHEFLGGNFFMLQMLNRYRADLGTKALPHELEAGAQRTIRHLQSSTAQVALENVRVSGERLQAQVVVRNLAGHKLPTAYPSRRVWLHLTVRDRSGAVIFESGSVGTDGAIAGNDGDADPLRAEPHHREITTPEQVQIYESVMADARGQVTTGLLSGVRFMKDNRILPRGFDKASAHADIAVRGTAADDPDFVGGADRVGYAISIAEAQGPFRVDVSLSYQPIAFRWARNLRRHQSEETDRFMKYYDTMASGSSVVLARDSSTVR